MELRQSLLKFFLLIVGLGALDAFSQKLASVLDCGSCPLPVENDGVILRYLHLDQPKSLQRDEIYAQDELNETYAVCTPTGT